MLAPALSPTAKVCGAAKVAVAEPGDVVLSRTDTLFTPEPLFETTRSGRPSPLRSGVLSPEGPIPVGKACCAAKLTAAAPVVVVLSNTDTVLSLLLGTTRSGLPSPLMSAGTATTGPFPVLKVCCAAY